MEDVSAIIILFSNALCTQVKRRRVSYHHTCSIALGTQVKRKWRTPQLVPYFFYCFGCSGREKMQDVSLILIVSDTFCLFKSRERGWGFSCYHTFPSTFGIRFKRKWRTSRLSQFFWHFGSPSQETVEDIWVFSIFFSVLWILSREKVEDVSAIIILFPLLWEPPDVPWVSLSSD